jgi:hypothetical protein
MLQRVYSVNQALPKIKEEAQGWLEQPNTPWDSLPNVGCTGILIKARTPAAGVAECLRRDYRRRRAFGVNAR